MSSNDKAKFAFSVALILLFLSGIGASLTIVRLYLAEGWVHHTYAVEVAIGDLESALATAGRDRIAYVQTGTADSLADFWKAVDQVKASAAGIRNLTADNPAEQALCDRIETNANRRMAPSIQAVQLREENRSSSEQQMQATVTIAETAMETAVIVQQMRQHEDGLLAQRSLLSKRLFEITVCILAVSFVLSVLMFWIHYRLLNRELGERVAAENELRQLSVQLMRVRDEESRRFARELHDGLGQNLVAAKLTADSLQNEKTEDAKLRELCAILEDCVSQTRTISYLLHPPMLDEMGFGSAAQWFVEGYAQRTSVAVSCHISPEAEHLPRHLELTLFRILQEALTNIHRHSKSERAEVSISVKSQEVTLIVRDYGSGIPADVLTNFRTNGTHVGVGLAGMKERVRELNGELEIMSDATGTQIIVKVPMTAERELSATAKG